MQHNVKAIVDWKWIMNGDPLTDVANFTMMFLQPEDVDYKFRHLAGHELLIGMNRFCDDLTSCIIACTFVEINQLTHAY